MVVDTSAIIEIALGDPLALECAECLHRADGVFISMGTLVETLIVGRRRGVGGRVDRLLQGWRLTEVPVTSDGARQVAEVYDHWGRGVHPASLNMGDCYAYALAKEMNLPLLFVGDDFSKTDVIPAL
ncbi:type II toxin-antitoxin system VapC family toxin [Nitrospirillum sp. BR 11752]|uniref:type II toxin-antitoxin system VapC family toxin n=1 Tax=Nitrospirillum sp. BR 11752 TaxID=3104293 RepID=UPI002EB3F4BF|nr:type II toxin-antitoxin system VapC family toxin [Nitrospirillum sp. BR 11752]